MPRCESRRRNGLLWFLVLTLGVVAPVTQAADAQVRPLRIGLLDGVASFTFASATAADIVGPDGVAVAHSFGRQAWTAKRSGRRIVLSSGTVSLASEGPVRVNGSSVNGSPALVYVGNHWYRGQLEIRPGLVAVNEVPLEEYLYGVVPCEMPHGWPAEALKSQAVAARTYALANLGEYASRGYDLKPTTYNQVYGGASRETPATNLAVDATRGEVLTYNGRTIPAYYCSAAGGYTDGAETVWLTAPVPYLQPVPDFDQAAPSYIWHCTLQAESLRTDLARHGVRVGTLLGIEPLTRGYSGRVKMLTIKGSAGTKEISGENFRQATGLKSSLFNVAPVLDANSQVTGFAFAGRGHGHGLGLSQWGARGLSEMGYSYAQILSHYYPSATLSTRQASLP